MLLLHSQDCIGVYNMALQLSTVSKIHPGFSLSETRTFEQEQESIKDLAYKLAQELLDAKELSAWQIKMLKEIQWHLEALME